jgi:hypothetical protein
MNRCLPAQQCEITFIFTCICSEFNHVTVHEKEQQKVQDVANQRLELLRRKQKDIYEAVMWLRGNKKEFRHHIYEPMMLEVRAVS